MFIRSENPVGHLIQPDRFRHGEPGGDRLDGKGFGGSGDRKSRPSEPDEYLGEVNAKTEWLRQFQECLTYCYYQTASFKTIVETLNTLTGSSYTTEDQR